MSSKSGGSLRNLNSFIKGVREETKSNRDSEVAAENSNMSINSDKIIDERTRNDNYLTVKNQK